MLSLITLLVVCASVAQGTLVSWLGLNNDYNNIINWVGSVIPGLTDDATIGVTGGSGYNATITANTAASSLTLAGSSSLTVGSGLTASFTTFTITSGFITLASGSSLHVGTLNLNAQSVQINGTGSLYVNSSLVFTTSNGVANISAKLYNYGNIHVDSGAILTITGDGYNNGSINVGTSGNGGALVIATTTWDQGAATSISGSKGTLALAGSGTHPFAVGVYNLGLLEVSNSATITVSGDTTVSGSVAIADNGTVNVNGANLTTTEVQLSNSSSLSLSGGAGVAASVNAGDNSKITASGTNEITSVNLDSGAGVAVSSSSAKLTINSLVVNGKGNANYNGAVTGSGSGSGWVYVNSLTQTNGGTFTVNTAAAVSGPVHVDQGSNLIFAGAGNSAGATLNLGSSSNPGQVTVLTGSFTLGSQFAGSSTQGTVLFSSASTSSNVEHHVWQAGTWTVTAVKAANTAAVTLAGAITVTGSVVIDNTAQVIANASLTVQDSLNVTSTATLTVAGGAVTTGTFFVDSGATYAIYATTTTPAKVNATARALVYGHVTLYTDVQVDANTNITILVYGVNSRVGQFSGLTFKGAAQANLHSQSPLLFMKRSLFAQNNGQIQYDSDHAYIQGSAQTSDSSKQTIAGSFVTLLVTLAFLFAW